MKNRSGRWLIVLLAALSVWGLVDVRRRGYPYPDRPGEHRTDLTVYTEAGAAFFDGREPYEVANPRGWTYLYPPLFALLLAPLHPLPTQDQVTVWFFISLLFCWGCYRECRRIVAIVCAEDPSVAAAWKRWLPWLVVAAVAAATLSTLNCLQRGQVGIVKFYLLLLGLRVVLSGRSYRAWLIGGIVLALPVVFKILPALPVGFLLFFEMVEWLWSYARRGARSEVYIRRAPSGADIPVCPGLDVSPGRQECLPHCGVVPVGIRFASSTVGVAFGLVLFFLLIPAMLVGWNANLRHLDTWGRFMLTKADNGGMDPRSGNSHSIRNQSLQNGAYRFGNFLSHALSGGPDDRLVERFDAPQMAMDSPVADRFLFLSRALIGLTLLALGVRLARQPGSQWNRRRWGGSSTATPTGSTATPTAAGSRLNMATGFALSCVTMLSISPVGRAHYFMLLVPAILFVPLWLDLRGRRRTGIVLAATLSALPLLHYALLPYAGRVGLLGLGTTAWLLAAMAIIARTDSAAVRASRQEESQTSDSPAILVHAA
jgi:hypothetical protein